MKLLLNEDKIQARALIVTANEHQAHCLGEVIHNILKLPVGKKAKRLIAKHKKILLVIANFGLSLKKRLKVLQAAAAKIVELLWSVKQRLMAVLN